MKNCFRITSLFLTALLLLCSVSCSGGAPELEQIRDELTALIDASYEINDIFFGAGLPVYDREDASGDGSAQYDEASKTYYWIIDDPSMGKVIKIYPEETKKYVYLTEDPGKAPENAQTVTYRTAEGTERKFYEIVYEETKKEYVYDEDSPVHYDYVRLECPYQTVESIKEAASKVYSGQYLAAIYGVIFDGFATDNEIVYARYMEDESAGSDFFLKSNQFEPYFEEQTTYDPSTMKIVKPSRRDFINVEIEAFGRFIDYDTLTVTTGKHTVTLKFVKENGEWRLDTPTY